MLVQISVAYNCEEQLKKLGRENYLALRDKLPNLKFPDWLEGKEKPEYYYEREQFIEFENDAPLLLEAGIQFEVKRFKQNYFVDKVFDESRKQFGDKQGSPISVHIPNIGLLMIDEVDWLENACTEQLQGYLDDGWRILAVCPPNGTRRPDYILGRHRGVS
jgi:hypothetical protein